MGMFNFGIREGSWWVYSKKDLKWNSNGRSRGTITIFQHEAELYVESKKRRTW